ncbi:MAG: hypothetical protein ACRDOL_38320 [Streptosporangiaceae bacterium]
MPATARATYETKNDQWEGIKKDPSAGCPDKNVVGKYSFLLPDLGEAGVRELRDPDAEDDEIPD